MTENDKSTVLERQEQKTKPPASYQVVLLNDDYTPQYFVVEILRSFFNKSEAEAFQIMMFVHEKGRGVCGVYTKEVAETKVELVLTQAREEGHPLNCVMEAL